MYVAVSYINGSYIHLAASPVGTNIWTVNIPSSSSINKTGVAANDLYGNPGVLVVTPSNNTTRSDSAYSHSSTNNTS